MFKVSAGATPNIRNAEQSYAQPFQVKGIKNCVQKEGAILVIAKSGISEEDAIGITGQQVPRVVTDKPVRDIIFLNKEAFDGYEKTCKKLREMELSLQDKSFNNALSAILKYSALKQKALLIEDADISSYRKLYISGHGNAGVGCLGSGSQLFSVPEIVDALQTSGILEQIKDIRLTSCGSADKRKPTSFSKEHIENARKESGTLEKILSGEKHSLAEHVSQEIWSRGFTDVHVSGYHGNGVFVSSKEENLPQSHLRSLEIPAVNIIRRSDVRVILTSQVD
ncbi:OspB protein [Grimontia hollisae]|uniref:OspB protein n=1 Tax=Grimontia hollisae TaxID=673 RepID=UPI00165DF70B|nr:OspB protein [Grimontia hollisae]